MTSSLQARSSRYRQCRATRTHTAASMTTLLIIAILTLPLATSAAKGVEKECVAAATWVYANPRFVPNAGLRGVAAEVVYDKDALDYVHMGMMEVLSDGTLLAAWQGATVFWEGSQNQSIYMARSSDAGHTWQSPQVLVASQGRPLWAPVLHVEGSTTWLFYSQSRPQCIYDGEGGRHWGFGGDINMIVSKDGGHSWSDPELILSFDKEGGIGKMVANKLVVGPNGEWLLPFWREMSGLDCNHAPAMHGKAGVLHSDEKDHAWDIADVQLSSGSPPTWLIEGTISVLPDKEGFLQLFRTQVGTIYGSRSQNGVDWSDAESIGLPNPNSKVDSLTLPDGCLVLAFNDDPKQRTKLTLATSGDGGKTWQRQVVLENDPQGSFSYPTLQFLPEQNQILVIYSVGFTSKQSAGMDRIEEGLQRAKQFETEALQEFGAVSMEEVVPQKSIDAWGRDAYGLRVAIVDLALLNKGSQ